MAPGTMRLKLKYDELLSKLAFKYNLRCYSMAMLVVCGADSATQSVLSQVNVAIGGGKR